MYQSETSDLENQNIQFVSRNIQILMRFAALSRSDKPNYLHLPTQEKKKNCFQFFTFCDLMCIKVNQKDDYDKNGGPGEV